MTLRGVCHKSRSAFPSNGDTGSERFRDSFQTPILIAMAHGHTECVQELLAKGASQAGLLDAARPGQTAIHEGFCLVMLDVS